MTGYLNIDLDDILNSGGFIPANIDGHSGAVLKRIHLNPPQMNMFSSVDVTKMPDGSAWLDFLSEKYAPTEELMEMMAYCVELWGLDSEGKGGPSKSDVDDLRNGDFFRLWDKVKILQTKRDGCPSLTIAMRIIIDNKDMSNFINQLAKGFVRSAVNQVGRDGGRVISNQIYNGKNYVPVSDVTDHNALGRSAREDMVPSNARSTTKPLSAFKIILMVFLSFFAMPVGSVGVLIYGLVKYFKTTDKIQWEESIPQHVSDRRYKTGTRYIGNALVTKTETVTASPDIIAINKRKGILALILGGVTLVFFVCYMVFIK